MVIAQFWGKFMEQMTAIVKVRSRTLPFLVKGRNATRGTQEGGMEGLPYCQGHLCGANYYLRPPNTL